MTGIKVVIANDSGVLTFTGEKPVLCPDGSDSPDFSDKIKECIKKCDNTVSGKTTLCRLDCGCSFLVSPVLVNDGVRLFIIFSDPVSDFKDSELFPEVLDKKTGLKMNRFEAAGIFLSRLTDIITSQTLEKSDKRELEKIASDIKETEERMNLVYKASNEGLWDWNIKTGSVYLSPRYYLMLGYTSRDFSGYFSDIFNLLHSEDKKLLRQAVNEFIERGSDLSVVLRFRKKDGEYLWIRVKGWIVEKDENGSPVRAIGTNTDITSMVLSEEEKSKTEKRLALALNAANEGIWDWDLKTNKAYFSPKYYTMLGYEDGEFPADFENWRNHLHPDDVEKSGKIIMESISSSTAFEIEFRFRTKDGDYRWLLGRGKVIESDKDGKPIRAVGTHVDIHERKIIENELLKSEKRLRFITDSISDTVWLLDNDMKVLFVNPSVGRYSGFMENELVGRSFYEILSAKSVEIVRSVFKQN
jgi:PAS domain S-box-containing protein